MTLFEQMEARLAALPVKDWHVLPDVDEGKMVPVLTDRAAELVCYVGSRDLLKGKEAIASFIAHAPKDVQLLLETVAAMLDAWPADVPTTNPEQQEAFAKAKANLIKLGLRSTDAELFGEETEGCTIVAQDAE